MWKWVEELLEHRESIRLQRMQHELDLRHCNSCEIIQAELNRAHGRELELLKLLKPEAEEVTPSVERHLPLTAKIPWAVKRQQLEKAARSKKNGEPKPKEITVDDLDDELDEIRGK